MEREAHESSLAYQLILASACICVGLGCLGVLGGQLKSTVMMQGFLTSSPMFYNTALGFILCGIGFVGVYTQSSRVLILVGSLVALLGILTLSEYLFGVNLGIDQLFIREAMLSGPYPGRMSPATAICFIFSGLGLLLSENHRLSQWLTKWLGVWAVSIAPQLQLFSQTTVLLELVSVVVAVWGLMTCLLYLLGIMGPHILGSIGNMAIYSAVGFVAVSLGLWAVVWQRNKPEFFVDPLAAFITGVFTVALVFQLGLSSLASKNFLEVQESIEQEKQSERLVVLLEQLFSQLQDAETGQRGYLLTKEDAYLKPYNIATTAIQTTVGEIEVLAVESYALGQEQLRTLKELIEQKLTELHETIFLQQQGNSERALAVVRSNRGKEIMDQVRNMIHVAIDSERTAIVQKSKTVNANMQATSTNLFYGNGFSLILTPVAAALVSWQLWQRRKTETDVRVLNRTLDQQVRERIAELATTNVELQKENATRLRIEESLAHSLQDLARSNSELEHFAHVASHDLQEPLRKILAFGDRLKVKCAHELSDQGKDYVERMQSAANRMQGLIDALLTFSRVTTQPRPFAPVDLSAVAHTIVSDLEVSIQRVNGQVQIEPLPTIDADAVQIGQVLQNLISNALKFHRPDVAPLIVISAEPANDSSGNGKEKIPYCRIAVRDNGIGFEAQYTEKIFQPFQRLFARGEYEGTGMGLAICKKIIERHGGTITAQSVPGQGTTFILTLPVQLVKKEEQA